MQNLWKTYDDITGILRKRKIPKNAFEKWLTIFPKKILGSCILLTYKRLMKILRWTEEKS